MIDSELYFYVLNYFLGEGRGGGGGGGGLVTDCDVKPSVKVVRCVMALIGIRWPVRLSYSFPLRQPMWRLRSSG